MSGSRYPQSKPGIAQHIGTGVVFATPVFFIPMTHRLSMLRGVFPLVWCEGITPTQVPLTQDASSVDAAWGVPTCMV